MLNELKATVFEESQTHGSDMCKIQIEITRVKQQEVGKIAELKKCA